MIQADRVTEEGPDPTGRPRGGADLIVEALQEEGVRVLFGHPGGAILPFYDALHGLSSPRHVLMRHEQAAAHAADGYARSTGEVGVCVATSGPGATNLVTGLATALMDSVPLVAITGQVPSTVLGTEAFQEMDIVGVTMAVTKHGFLVQSVEDLPVVLKEAFDIATGGRPGPVLIDVPKDLLAAPVGGHRRSPPEGASPQNGQGRCPDLAAETARVGELLDRAERPVLMVGRGVVLSETQPHLAALVERADLPVVSTLLGLDAFPASDRRALGMPGMHGTERANQAIQAADLLIGLGLRFDDRVTGRVDAFAPNARIVHFDVDPAAFGRTVEVDDSIRGDLRDTLPMLLSAVPAATRSDWWRELRGWRREASRTDPMMVGSSDLLTARGAVCRIARWIAERDGLVATDVGQHQMWFAQELPQAKPRTHLTSGGLGTMGYSLPAAIGAAAAFPERESWAVTGDGGFQMNVQELATLRDENLPVRVAVINNSALGMVRQWQEFVYERRYVASALSGPDFARLARAYGIPACRVQRPGELERALSRTELIRGPLLIDVRVPAEDSVFPMLPPGSALDELVLSPSAMGDQDP